MGDGQSSISFQTCGSSAGGRVDAVTAGGDAMCDSFHSPHTPIVSKDYCELEFPSTTYPALVLVHHESEIVPTHWHAGLEINYVIEGTGAVTIDSDVQTLHPGKLCIISPYAVHNFVAEDRDGLPPLILSVSFDGAKVSRVYEAADRFLLSPDAPGSTDDDRKAMTDLCMRLLEATDDDSPEITLRINSLLYDMLYLAYDRFVVRGRKSPVRKSGRNVLQPVIGYIESHYNTMMTASELAEHFGYSREYFSRLFKRCNGIGFKEYLTALRLQDAYHQLMFEEETSLVDIARSSGFPSVRSMSAAFERRYGEPPLRYRSARLRP
ncbi:MAG: AraC family transcriptional regulator [Bifidobacterium sp.]